MRTKGGNKIIVEQHDDTDAQPYIEQLMNGQNFSQVQTHDLQSNELNNSTDTRFNKMMHQVVKRKRKARGPTILKDIWKLPSGKIIVVQLNDRNQPIRKEGRKLASFLGIIATIPELTPLNIDDWRNFFKEEKKKLMEFVKKKFSIPSRGEAYVIKSIEKKWKDYKCDLKNTYTAKYKTKYALLRNKPSRIPRDQWIGRVSYWLSDKVKAENGIEPIRAQVFILTNKQRKDGRSLDAESARTIVRFLLFHFLNFICLSGIGIMRTLFGFSDTK
nr:uncharacterized protein LOC108948612 [Nicotiana tomentosiformis]